jgi:GDPmannose 4,6-dehydratase
MAFNELGIEVEFSGKDENERGVIIDIDEQKARELGLNLDALKFGQTVVKVDAKYFRPTEVDLLIGDATKAKEKLGWVPKYNLQLLVSDMVQSDLHLVKKDDYLKKGGFKTLNYFE